jgi:hypothetical protein
MRSSAAGEWRRTNPHFTHTAMCTGFLPPILRAASVGIAPSGAITQSSMAQDGHLGSAPTFRRASPYSCGVLGRGATATDPTGNLRVSSYAAKGTIRARASAHDSLARIVGSACSRTRSMPLARPSTAYTAADHMCRCSHMVILCICRCRPYSRNQCERPKNYWTQPTHACESG